MTTSARIRREPPRFRPVAVTRTEQLSPHMIRVTLAGAELEGLIVDQPAASVRLLLPSTPRGELVTPAWNGNQFLLADGSRPTIRTLTPRRVDTTALELDVDIVVHDVGAASGWARQAQPGDPAAVSGPARGYMIDSGCQSFLLAGDETAIPAISQLLETLPRDAEVRAHVELAHPEAELALPDHPHAAVAWHVATPVAPPGSAFVAAVHDAEIGPATRVWVAGEAGAVQRVRRHLFEDRALSRRQATVRGYWKHGRTADTETDDAE